MRTKRTDCPTCSRDGRHPLWESTWSVVSTDTDCVLRPIWRCRCCHREAPRRVNARKNSSECRTVGWVKVYRLAEKAAT